MLETLRRRLTALFSLLTAAVLAAALAVTCRRAQNEYAAAADLLFASAVAAVEDTVAESGLVRDSWLARQETAGRLVISIEDNGQPLAFPGGWTPPDPRSTLTGQAREQAAAAGLDPARARRQRVSFALAGAGLAGRYTGTALVLPQGRGVVTVYILRDDTQLHAHLRAMAWQYAGLWAAGAAVLAVLCRWMVSRALRPTAQAWQQQREFIAAAGHELRSPLAVLKASLQAAQDPAAAARVPQLLRSAEAETDRLTRLTGDLLILAGGDAGALRAELAELPLDTFLIELYDRFAPVARARPHADAGPARRAAARRARRRRAAGAAVCRAALQRVRIRPARHAGRAARAAAGANAGRNTGRRRPARGGRGPWARRPGCGKGACFRAFCPRRPQPQRQDAFRPRPCRRRRDRRAARRRPAAAGHPRRRRHLHPLLGTAARSIRRISIKREKTSDPCAGKFGSLFISRDLLGVTGTSSLAVRSAAQ